MGYLNVLFVYIEIGSRDFWVTLYCLEFVYLEIISGKIKLELWWKMFCHIIHMPQSSSE